MGVSLAHARSLLTNAPLWIQPFTPEDDTHCLDQLARWALRFSPVVAPDYPNGLLLDIAGCEHLYGGEERLAEKVVASLERFGLSVRLAIAPTFACAQAVARYGKNRITIIPDDAIRASLTPLPVSALRIDQVVCEALTEVGIERVGELLRLPRNELAARFGSGLLKRLDQAVGIAPERIDPIHPSQPLEVTRVFDGPVTSIEAIQAVVADLLSALIAQLQKLVSGVRYLSVELRRVAVEPIRLSLLLTHASSDRAHLWSLLKPKLERMNLGYGVEEVRLQATRTERVGHEQMELWSQVSSVDHTGDGALLGKLLDQLIDRFGTNAVTEAQPVETYVPEQAFLSTAKQDTRSKEPGRKVISCRTHIYAASRPSRLFAVPEPVRVVALVPDGPPAWLAWRRQACAIRSSYGPERITLPWWTSSQPDRGGSPLVRDYYEVQDEHGRWLWLFRERESGRWFVHGEWA